VRGSREMLAETLAQLRGSQPYRNYELARERVFDMKDRAARLANADPRAGTGLSSWRISIT
jgi:hypothetical protein